MRFRFVYIYAVLALGYTTTHAITAPIHDAASKEQVAKVKALLKKNPKLLNTRTKTSQQSISFRCVWTP